MSSNAGCHEEIPCGEPGANLADLYCHKVYKAARKRCLLALSVSIMQLLSSLGLLIMTRTSKNVLYATFEKEVLKKSCVNFGG